MAVAAVGCRMSRRSHTRKLLLVCPLLALLGCGEVTDPKSDDADGGGQALPVDGAALGEAPEVLRAALAGVIDGLPSRARRDSCGTAG